MYRERLWTMRQYLGFGSAEETSRRFKFMIDQGQSGLSVAFDLPTQLGYDSDNRRAKGEVGRVGVPISSLRDMEILFQGIDLSHVSTSMTINATAGIILAMYVATAQMQGAPTDKLRGTTQNDILKEYIARNTFVYPPEHSLKLATDIIEYSMHSLPKWYPISISGYHIREAGANAIQELAFSFANAIAYVETAISRRLRVDQFAPRLSFFFACRNEFFEEIAKFRAARRIWARIMKEKFKAKKTDSLKLRFHTQTSGETLTAQQPEINIVRISIQALATVLGGTQSLHTNSKDEALSLPTEESAKLALRTQQIIAYETGATRVADPLGGSYYLEYLTSEIERQVVKELEKIERMGGALQAITSGYMQQEIRRSAYQQQQLIDSGETIMVGVNKFVDKEEPSIKPHTIDPRSEEAQLKRLKQIKEMRESKKVHSALEKVQKAAERGQNLMPFFLAAVKEYATLGEISDVLRNVYGEYRPPTIF